MCMDLELAERVLSPDDWCGGAKDFGKFLIPCARYYNLPEEDVIGEKA